MTLGHSMLDIVIATNQQICLILLNGILTTNKQKN